MLTRPAGERTSRRSLSYVVPNPPNTVETQVFHSVCFLDMAGQPRNDGPDKILKHPKHRKARENETTGARTTVVFPHTRSCLGPGGSRKPDHRYRELPSICDPGVGFMSAGSRRTSEHTMLLVFSSRVQESWHPPVTRAPVVLSDASDERGLGFQPQHNQVCTVPTSVSPQGATLSKRESTEQRWHQPPSHTHSGSPSGKRRSR